MEHEAEHKALSEQIAELQVRVIELEKLVAELHKDKLERDAEDDFSDDPDPEEASTEEEESEEEEEDEDVIPLVISVERVKRRRKN